MVLVACGSDENAQEASLYSSQAGGSASSAGSGGSGAGIAGAPAGGSGGGSSSLAGAGQGGTSGGSGQGGEVNVGGSAGEGGASGGAGESGASGQGGEAGGGGFSGEAGASGQGGAAGEGGAGGGAGAAGCGQDPSLGGPCTTVFGGPCSEGTLQCVGGQVLCIPGIKPGEQAELCDGVDNDCDGFVDEGIPVKTFYEDTDGDGYGSTTFVQACAQPQGYSDKGKDCDDGNSEIFPGAVEQCDGIDSNCNGFVDEGVQKPTFFRDNDGDGFGGPTTILSCTAPQGYVAQSGDCNDLNPEVYPGAAESCDGADNNCNGLTDEGLPLIEVFNDLDGDGFGAKNSLPKKFCLTGDGQPPQGYSLNKNDCDDSKSTVYPGAPELCDGVLNNCSLKVADYQCPTKCAGSWPVAIGGGSGHVAFAQMDADAEWEVIAQQGGSTYVFEHDGTLKWKAAGSNYSYPSLGDFNHDSVLDVAVTNSGKVLLLSGVDGSTIATVTSPAASVWYGSSIFDLDGNGWPDVVPTSSGKLDVLYLGASGQLLSALSLSPLAGEPGYNLAPAGLFDLNGDGKSEIFAATGSWGCAGNLPTCKGRFFVHDQEGNLYNDPTWTDAAKPWFQVDSYPNSYGGEGLFPVVADFDGDGTPELFQPMNNNKPVWAFDGTPHPLTGTFANNRIFAPVNLEDGTLTDGKLNPVDRAIIDIEGDGTYEAVGAMAGGFGVSQKGKPMDGYPIPISGGQPTLADLNRDGALDVLWVGSNNAVNCWSLKGGTFDARRVLHSGGMGAFSPPGIYPTQSYDPYEPNQPAGAVDPTTSTNPVVDFRPFLPYGLRDQFSSGGGWRNSLRGAIGAKGDADYFWFTNSYSNISISSDVAQKLRLDLDVFVFVPDGGGWKYSCEGHITDTTGSSFQFHPIQATGTCPVGLGGTKGFLVRVKGHNPDTDFGPWPYSLSFMWQ